MITINNQAILFFTCVKIGFIMGALYDIIRVFRRLVTHPSWFIHFEDFFYWVTCGCIAFIMVYKENYGQIRFFVFWGILIGGVLYFSIISKYVMKILTYIIKNFILLPIKCIMKLLSIPIKHILNIYKAVSSKCKIRHRNFTKKINRKKTNISKQFKLLKRKK